MWRQKKSLWFLRKKDTVCNTLAWCVSFNTWGVWMERIYSLYWCKWTSLLYSLRTWCCLLSFPIFNVIQWTFTSGCGNEKMEKRGVLIILHKWDSFQSLLSVIMPVSTKMEDRCVPKGWFMSFIGQSRGVMKFTVLLKTTWNLNVRSIYLWNFLFNIVRPQLTRGNWNCKKQNHR